MTTIVLALAGVVCGDLAPGGRDRTVAGAREVVGAIRQAGEENRRRTSRLTGDALTEHYVQTAARAASRLPAETAGRAFLLGLGVGLDPSDLMRRNLLVGRTWRQVESDSERRARLTVLGSPSMHGRVDLAQHFVVSAALTVLLGEAAAESAGVVKELLDAREGGSGFSFADLAADLSGIALARRVLKDTASLGVLVRGFRVTDYCLSPRGLPEGLTTAEFERRYGGVKDDRYRAMRNDLVDRIAALPGYRRDR